MRDFAINYDKYRNIGGPVSRRRPGTGVAACGENDDASAKSGRPRQFTARQAPIVHYRGGAIA
jgi:hypothetical protein